MTLSLGHSTACKIKGDRQVLFPLILRADNTVVGGFGMCDRCSFFHVELIELILRSHFTPEKGGFSQGMS